MQDNANGENFENSFAQSVRAVPAEHNDNEQKGGLYKKLTFIFAIMVLVLLIVIVVVLFGVGASSECDCENDTSQQRPYGDFSVLRDDEGNVMELLMFCKADDGKTLELMEDFRYVERDAKANFLDYGTYSIMSGNDIMLELSSDRIDKYVYFDGRSLVNMDEIYHCLQDEE